MIFTLRRYADVNVRWIFGVYLLLIGFAEWVTAVWAPYPGLSLHALLLVVLTLHGAFGRDHAGRMLALALTLAPLIRLLSLSLPLLSFPQMAWYPLVSVPLLVAMWLIVRQLGVARPALGLQLGTPLVQLCLMGFGFSLGVLEYIILQPEPLITELSWQALWLPALSLLIFTGFTEEIIFRGLLQSLAFPVLGRWGLWYVATLFAVLHTGYLSFTDVVFVFAVGVIFAFLVLWSGSILGVTLAHGITNIMLFLVLPFVIDRGVPRGQIMWLTVGATGVSLAAIGSLAWQAWRNQRFLRPPCAPTVVERA